MVSRVHRSSLESRRTTVIHHLRKTRVTRLAGGLGDRARAFLRRLGRSRAYPVLGAVLALGMPFGLVIVQATAARRWPSFAGAWIDMMTTPSTYAYVTAASVLTLILLGTLVGGWFDQARRLGAVDPLTGLLNRRSFA